MKMKKSLRGFVALCIGLPAVIILSLQPSSSRAASLTWDGADATFNTSYGGGGNWNTSTANWTNASTDQVWTDTTGTTDTAVFATTAGTVTVGTNVGALGLQFATTGYTLTSGTITLGSSGINASTLTSGTTTISSSLTLLPGFQSWTVGSGGKLAINGTVTRNTGAAVNFSTAGVTSSSLTNDATGILGGWATVGNAGTSGASGDFAAVDGTGNIITYASYTNITGSTTGAGASAQNWKVTNAAGSLTASATVNSLVLTTDFNIQSGATMTLGSGGLILSGVSRWLKNNGAGSTAGTGQLTSGLASGELFIDSSASGGTGDNDWQIWTKIIDNGGTAVKFIKTGPGYLKLNGADTYTGGTIMNGGTLVGTSASAFGTGAIQVNSGALSTNLNAGTMANNFTVATGASVTIDNATNNGTLNGNFSGGGTVTIQNTSGGANLSENVNGNWSGFAGTLNYNTSNRVVNIFAPASMDLSNAAVNFVNTSNLTNSSFRVSGTTRLGSLSGFGYLDVVGVIEVGNLNTSGTYSGLIRDNGGAGTLRKIGSGTLTLTGASTNTGGAVINGGTLSLGNVAALSTSSGGISFGGGTLQYGSGITTDYSARIAAGTSTSAVAIDTGTNNVTFATALTSSQSGGLTKSGSGMLTLSANNAYTGVTTINLGTLSLTGTINNTGGVVVNSGGTLAVTGTIGSTGGIAVNAGGTFTLSGAGAVASGNGITINGSGAKFVQTSSVVNASAVTLTTGTLDGTGTIGAVTVGNGTGGIITNGNGSTTKLTVGSLTFNGAGTISLNKFNDTSTVALSATGALVTTPANGNVTLNVLTAPVWSLNTAYNLIGYGSFGGSNSDFTVGSITGLATRQTASVGNTGSGSGFITLTVSGDNPVWSGANGGTWTTAATNDNSGSNNWALKTGQTATNFWVGDKAEFNDTFTISGTTAAPTTTTVNIHGGNVSPTSAIFNNSSLNYTVTSDDGSGIAAGFVTLNGTGNVTISTVNSYSGGTTINAGTLTLSGSGNLGATSSALAMGGGTLDLGASSQTVGALTITVAAASGNTIQNGSLNPSSVTVSNASGNAIVTANLGGSGAVTMSGSGTLTLGGSNSFSGGTLVKSGTVVLAGGGSLSASNTVTMGDSIANTSGILQLGNSSGAANTTVTSLTNVGSGTGNAVVGGNAGVSTLTVNNSGAVSYGGKLGGAGTNQNNLALAKSGAGTLTLTAANTYNGGTTITAGTVAAANDTGLGTGAVTLNGGGFSEASGDRFLSNNFIIGSNGGTIATPSGNLTLSGTLSGAGNISLAANTAVTSLNFEFAANTMTSGTVTTASVANDQTVFRFNKTAATSSLLDWVFNAAGNRGNYLGTSGTYNFGSFAGTGIVWDNFLSGQNLVLSIGGNNHDAIFGGTIRKNNATISVLKIGTGTETFSGANTYDGGTTLTSGTLVFGNNSALGSGTAILNGGTLKAGGGFTLANNINVTATSIFDMAANNTTLSGNISGSAALNFNNSGVASTLTLSGTNSGYSGTVTVNNNNAVSFNSANSGSANAAWVFNDATGDRVRINVTGTNTLNFGSLSGSGQIQNDTAASLTTLSVGALNTDTTFSGTMKDNTGILALTKTGNGTLTLTGNNTYTGATNVNAGTLAINGTNSGTGTVTVAGSATLNGTGSVSGAVVVSGTLSGSLILSGSATINNGGTAAAAAFNGDVKNNGTVTSNVTILNGKTASGTGTFSGSVTVASGGTMAPGNSAGIVNTGDFSLQSGAHLSIEIGSTTAGSGYDQVNVTGGITLAGDLTGSLINGFGSLIHVSDTANPLNGDVFYIIINDGADAVSGAFSNQVVGGTSYSGGFNTITVGGQEFAINYQADASLGGTSGFTATNGNDVALMAVPEPATWAMLVGGFGMLAAWRRSRRRKA